MHRLQLFFFRSVRAHEFVKQTNKKKKTIKFEQFFVVSTKRNASHRLQALFYQCKQRK